MGNKNYRGSAAQVRPSEQFFNKSADPLPATPTKSKRNSGWFVDLSTLTQHPSITIVSNKEISIYIEMCSYMDEEPTDIPALRAILPEYKSVKKLSIKIHAPWPKTEPREWYNNRVSSIKKLFAIIDNFKLYTLKITMSIDGLNFPQMKLGAAVYSLKFKRWDLFYQVYDESKKTEEDAIKIHRGSEYDLRLRGVYKKEFCQIRYRK